MTGRVCPIHGEYSASGVCRWCEPKPRLPGIPGIWPIYLPTVADLPIQPPYVLEYQHAALRWERVARRWNYKHRSVGGLCGDGGLDEDGRAYVWRAWLSQVDRVYRASMSEQPP